MEPVHRMIDFESAGNGAGTRRGDREVNVAQQVIGIKGDKKIQCRLIMCLIRRYEKFLRARAIRNRNQLSSIGGQLYDRYSMRVVYG